MKRGLCQECGFPLGDSLDCKTCGMYLHDQAAFLEDLELVGYPEPKDLVDLYPVGD
jgi:hypothetical protein